MYMHSSQVIITSNILTKNARDLWFIEKVWKQDCKKFKEDCNNSSLMLSPYYNY